MSTVVSVKSKLWTGIYYRLRDHLLEDGVPPTASKIAYLEDCLASMGIIMHKRGEDDAVWTHVEFTDDVDVTELVLRWS